MDVGQSVESVSVAGYKVAGEDQIIAFVRIDERSSLRKGSILTAKARRERATTISK